MRSAGIKLAIFGVVLGVGVSLAGVAASESYLYDVLDRLTVVTADNGVVTYYCYDPAGNRTYVGTTACVGGGGASYESMVRTGPLTSVTSAGGTTSTTQVVPSTTTVAKPTGAPPPIPTGG